MQHQPLIVRWAMPFAIVALFVLALAPIRATSWTNWFAAQVKVAIVPITHPLTIVVDTIVPSRIADPEASQREQAIANELGRVRLELLQIREENQRLNQLIDQFSRGTAITPDMAVKQVPRPRISNLIGDLLLIRTGRVDGLSRGTVVVVDAVQLLGRVSRVDGRTSTVLPITAKASQPILATVLLNESGTEQVRSLLSPVGDGTLRGEVAATTADDSRRVRVGQQVRLLDNQWPTHAQMLVVGEIERIERNEDQPLRLRIIVRPTVEDLRRVPEVILRIPITDHEGEMAPDTGGTP